MVPPSPTRSGNVQAMIARFESLITPEDGLSHHEARVAEVLDSESDDGAEGLPMGWYVPDQPEYTGERPRGPRNTPRLVAAIPGFQRELSTPVSPVLTPTQATGLILHEILTADERLTPVAYYWMLVNLDPNSTDLALAPYLAERRRRGIHLGRPHQLTTADILRRGIGHDFVPLTPAEPQSAQAPASSAIPPWRRGTGRSIAWSTGRGRGRGRGRANTLPDLRAQTPATPDFSSNQQWPAPGNAP